MSLVLLQNDGYVASRITTPIQKIVIRRQTLQPYCIGAEPRGDSRGAGGAVVLMGVWNLADAVLSDASSCKQVPGRKVKVLQRCVRRALALTNWEGRPHSTIVLFRNCMHVHVKVTPSVYLSDRWIQGLVTVIRQR